MKDTSDFIATDVMALVPMIHDPILPMPMCKVGWGGGRAGEGR